MFDPSLALRDALAGKQHRRPFRRQLAQPLCEIIAKIKTYESRVGVIFELIIKKTEDRQRADLATVIRERLVADREQHITVIAGGAGNTLAVDPDEFASFENAPPSGMMITIALRAPAIGMAAVVTLAPRKEFPTATDADHDGARRPMSIARVMPGAIPGKSRCGFGFREISGFICILRYRAASRMAHLTHWFRVV